MLALSDFCDKEYGSNKVFDALVDSNEKKAKIAAIKIGYGYDKLFKDKDPEIRALVAVHYLSFLALNSAYTFTADDFLHDESPLVRAVFVRYSGVADSYGEQILADKEAVVREAFATVTHKATYLNILARDTNKAVKLAVLGKDVNIEQLYKETLIELAKDTELEIRICLAKMLEYITSTGFCENKPVTAVRKGIYTEVLASIAEDTGTCVKAAGKSTD